MIGSAAHQNSKGRDPKIGLASKRIVDIELTIFGNSLSLPSSERRLR